MRTPAKVLPWMALMAAVICTIPAAAWGPRAESAIVSTAVHIVSGDVNIPLNRLEKEVQQGALVSNQTLQDLYPDLVGNPVAAIEAEMILLRAVNRQSVDPYFAYRLGALGKLVASTTAPLTRGDVESHIVKTPLEPSARMLVEPKSYFSRKIDEANVNTGVIEEEYRDGVGFRGVAGTMLSQDVSRAANATADVWYSILAGPEVAGGVSEAQYRRYALDAYRFYIARGKAGEIDAAAKRLDKLVNRDADLAAAVGDLYFENGFYDRAMAEYKTALALEPGRRDVTERISEYYVRQGEDALTDARLEDALESFETALNANALHPTAEAMRLEAAGMIRDREARLDLNRKYLEEGAGFQDLAEREASRDRYADAVGHLRESEIRYASVTDEFPLEYQKSLAALRDVRTRLDQLKNELIGSAQDFSGSGFALDAQDMAASYGSELDRQALRTMVRTEYLNQMQTVAAELSGAMKIQ